MKFFSMDGIIYRLLKKFSDFVILNVLWLLFSIPIVTFFSSTAAMFGVVNQWNKGKEVGVFKAFLKHFKINFLKSIFIGFVWIVIGYTSYINFFISLQLSESTQFFMFIFLICVFILFVMMSIYIFPVIVHYKVNLIQLLKNSFLFSLINLHITMTGVLLLLTALIINYFIPISIFIVWSVSAYFINKLCSRSFEKIEFKYITEA